MVDATGDEHPVPPPPPQLVLKLLKVSDYFGGTELSTTHVNHTRNSKIKMKRCRIYAFITFVIFHEPDS